MTSQRRHRCCGTAVKRLGPRVLSAFQVWLWLLVYIFQNELRTTLATQPGYLDFDNLPETNFTCVGKVIGGYYADLETSCQMFHVCTIGQQDEPMDIKFLCLNGTVFDQETRVCERVDEVDCSKSERFYSLNLELYGSTVPTLIEPEHEGSSSTEKEISHANDNDKKNPANKHATSNVEHKTEIPPTAHDVESEQEEINEGEEETDEESEDYVDYTEEPTTPTQKTTTTTRVQSKPKRPTETITQTIKTEPQTTTTVAHVKPSLSYGPPTHQPNPTPTNQGFVSPQEFINRHGPQKDRNPEAISFQRQTFPSDGRGTHLTVTTHNVEHHIEKQNQHALADKIYFTSATPPNERNPFDHLDKYEGFESAKHPQNQGYDSNIRPLLRPPKPQSGPIQFSLRNPARTPQGFKPSPTTQNPHSQLQSPNGKFVPPPLQKFEPYRPIQSYQPSEKHEIYENKYKLTSGQIPLLNEYDHFHYDHKRSHEEEPKIQQLGPRNAPSTNKSERKVMQSQKNLMKSPPRIIVTASASVSDSNGKKLNYTVGNILHEVKPIVTINYDNYKESDVLFDPFFLDVPKLNKRMKRGSKHKIKKRSTVMKIEKTKENIDEAPIINDEIPRAAISHVESVINITQDNMQGIKNETVVKMDSNKNATSNSTETIFPPDYVDDNYEPYVYDKNKEVAQTNNGYNFNVNENPNTTELTLKEISTKKHIKEAYIDTKSKRNKTYAIDELENELLRKILMFHQRQKENAQKMLELEMQLMQEDLIRPQELRLSSAMSSQMSKPPSEITKQKLKNTIIQTSTLKPLLTTLRPDIQYKLVSVKNIPYIYNTNSFTCSNKTFYKFYSDESDCRTFHLCSPGYSKSEYVDMLFECDNGLYFDRNTLNCVDETLSKCQL